VVRCKRLGAPPTSHSGGKPQAQTVDGAHHGRQRAAHRCRGLLCGRRRSPVGAGGCLPADCGAAFIFVQQRSTRREFRRKRSRLPAAASADTQSEDSARGRVDERVWRPNVASSVGEVKSVSNDMQVKLCRARLGQ
jgi:hypothetical protein